MVGGGACIPGFRYSDIMLNIQILHYTYCSYRLKEELVKLLTDDSKYSSLKSLKFKFHKNISNPNYTIWQGGKNNNVTIMYRRI